MRALIVAYAAALIISFFTGIYFIFAHPYQRTTGLAVSLYTFSTLALIGALVIGTLISVRYIKTGKWNR